MRSRGLVVAIAVVLAVLAAVGVIVYTSNIKETATTENSTEVIVSSQDIQANTPLDPLINANVFHTTPIPDQSLVDGAVTSVDQLRGMTASAFIFQNEQIPLSRVNGNVQPIGVSEGNVGIGLSVDGPAAVNGYVQQGSHVVLYATFNANTLVTRQTLKFFLKGNQINSVTGGSTANVIRMPTDYTFTLVPSVTIISAQTPPADATTGKPTSGSSTFVLDLSPEDAANVVFAIDHSTLYMGLLPGENQQGYNTPGVIGAPLGRVVGVK